MSKMQGIYKLRTDDFDVQLGAKRQPILCTGIKGFALVMFWSPSCPISNRIEPQFRRLPQIIPSRVKFGLLNINENQGIISLSNRTIAPITGVPYIVFYVDGRPILSYDD